jgi:F-type H+-transporting ATPase subunit epsilon
VIPVTVVDPEKIAWQGNASQVVLGIQDGSVGILPGHCDAVFALKPCIARIAGEDGKEFKLFLSGGIARVEAGKLTIVADSAETPEKIDKDRAEKAKKRAEQRLSESNRQVDYERARLALMRALHRLDLSN